MSFLGSKTSFAHPHSWIDMQTTVLGSEKAITGFKMRWAFDPMTTAYLFDGEDMTPQHKQQTLDKLSKEVVGNMLGSHYFTYFLDSDGKTPIRYKAVQHSELTQSKGKAILSFTITLVHPYPFNNQTLSLKIFDPTYYIDMSWATANDINLDKTLTPYCEIKLHQPNPTSAQVNYALSIPADADPDDSLGQLFTQNAKITCHTEHK
ncbi:DUF1007 family protein [Vibrio mediterranei]